MNSSQRNNLDFSSGTIKQFSGGTILEVSPDKTDDVISSKYVLIKHDYYSSDSDHGREMLAAVLDSLRDSSYGTLIIYLVDKGTLLLDCTNPLYDHMKLLVSKCELIIADEVSLDVYGISCDDKAKIVIQSFKSIAEDIIYLPDLLILE